MKHTEQADWLATRSDAFSKLLSRLLKDERRGDYLVTSSGISADEHEELIRLAPEAHASARVELSSALEALRGQLASWDPLYIAAMVQLHKTWGQWGTYYEPTQQGGEHYVELIGGLLCTRLPSAERQEPTDEALGALFRELEHIMEVLFLFNISRAPEDDSDQSELRVMSALRWMVMRGDSYGTHGIDLARALCAPYSAWMVETYGFDFDDLMKVAEATTTLGEERFNALFAESVEHGRALVAEFLDEYQAVGSPSPNEITMLEQAAAVAQISAGIRDAISVTPSEISSWASEISELSASAVLREMSVAVGSLDPSVYTGLFDRNPLRERPFLETEGRYLLVSPAMVLRDAVELVESRLLAGRPGYPASRAKTLDRLAVECLSSMLPGARSYLHLFYEDAQLDGLVLFEDVAIVVEGKASPVSVQGLRGDIVRLGRDIRDAVEEAWTQGARARAFILRDGDSVFVDEDGREVVTIPQGSVREVYIINPTLHELGGHAPQLPKLRSLGLFPEGEFPWSVFVNDLRVISETSENAAVFLHYLVWRSRLPLGERVSVIDELDLWGSYLLNERFGMLAESAGTVTVGNSTTDFDAYYDGVMGRGPKRHPPRKFLQEPVRSFVDRMATERPPGWRTAAGVCLDLSIAELAVVCGQAPRLAREAAKASTVIPQQIGRVALVAAPTGTDVGQ